MTDRLCLIPNCRGGGKDDDGNAQPQSAGEGITVCEHHYRRYRDGIAEIVDLYALLPTMLDPSTQPDTSGVRMKRTDPPAPLRLDVVALLDPRTERADDDTSMYVLGELDRACAAIRARRGIAQPDTEQPVTAVQRLLAAHAAWCAQHDWFPGLYDIVMPVVAVMRSATGMTPPKPVGRCHLPGRYDEKCGGAVHEIDGEGALECSRCRARWATPQELARFDLIHGSSA